MTAVCALSVDGQWLFLLYTCTVYFLTEPLIRSRSCVTVDGRSSGVNRMCLRSLAGLTA